ncbi:hypothetical protein BH11PSE10_BH11PSE10_05460 [soil metagenome]
MQALLRWPLPALLSWALAWGVFTVARRSGIDPAVALAVAALVCAGLALLHAVRWRRLIVALGFPLSLMIAGLPGGLPTWVWLLPLVLLAAVYPRRSWGDAPLFPTPYGALQPLTELAPLPAGGHVLDAGCGLGHGLSELHAAYPAAQVEGIEWSGLLARLARWRCPWAQVGQGDMWAQDWQTFSLVYVFQRPETMARVWAKACAELRPGAWLVSLDFEVAGERPVASLALASGHSLWMYQPQDGGARA